MTCQQQHFEQCSYRLTPSQTPKTMSDDGLILCVDAQTLLITVLLGR